MLPESTKGTYIVMNPISSALLARAANRVRAVSERDALTGDADITARRWLLIDADPRRPSGISATDAEHAAALDRVRWIRAVLRAEGWPDPILADSGNGGHLLYRVHLPADDGGLCKGALEALAAAVPHAQEVAAPSEGKGARFDSDAWIAEHLRDAGKPATWRGGRRWILGTCPWNPEHRDRAAYIVQLPSGALQAGCQHNGCAGKDWHALRDLLEPGWGEGRATASGSARAGGTFSPPAEASWPEPPGPAAFHGLAGRVVEAVDPHTEADPVAVLVSFLTAFGCAVGAGPHALVGATRHTPREYAALVGKTSKARKGDSWQPVRTLSRLAMPEFAERILGGLSSGEGLIWAVRDPIERREPIKEKGVVTGYQTVVVDEGVADKRLLVVEPELARVLRAMDRRGNTLSAVLRDAWDTGDLRTMTKNTPAVATAAHVALLGHITVEELRRELADIEAANGFANRILWFAVRRSKDLPEPEPFAGAIVEHLASELAAAVRRARAVDLIERPPETRELWRDVYAELAAERDGLAGTILARAEAHVLRLSLIYALLDGSATVAVEHLAAALEVWAYAERSVGFVFGDATGDPVADAIHAALVQNGELTRTQIRDLFGRHEPAGRIDQALQTLLRRGRVRVETRDTGGRPVEIWTAA